MNNYHDLSALYMVGNFSEKNGKVEMLGPGPLLDNQISSPMGLAKIVGLGQNLQPPDSSLLNVSYKLKTNKKLLHWTLFFQGLASGLVLIARYGYERTARQNNPQGSDGSPKYRMRFRLLLHLRYLLFHVKSPSLEVYHYYKSRIADAD